MLDVMPLHLWCRAVAVRTYYRLNHTLEFDWSGSYKNKTYSTSHIRYWKNIQEKLKVGTSQIDACSQKSADAKFVIEKKFKENKKPVHAELNFYTDGSKMAERVGS